MGAGGALKWGLPRDGARALQSCKVLRNGFSCPLTLVALTPLNVLPRQENNASSSCYPACKPRRANPIALRKRALGFLLYPTATRPDNGLRFNGALVLRR